MQLLQILRLWDRAAEVVNEDGSRAVSLQQRPQEVLQECDELLVLLGLAHLGGQRSSHREGTGNEELPQRTNAREDGLSV